jgi:serine/threonine-protein kinase HipA
MAFSDGEPHIPSTPDLGELIDLRGADVYKSARLAARISRVGADAEFRHLPGWLTEGGPPIASTLAGTAPQTTWAGALPSFFANLLPEGARLRTLVRAVKTSPDDELSLLLAVGSDLIGDVQVLPPGAECHRAPPGLGMSDLGDLRFEDVRDDLRSSAQREGLPGVQDKARLAGGTGLPGDEYLLKLAPVDAPSLAYNEAFFLRAAAECGVDAVDPRLVVDSAGMPALAVRRFDRAHIAGELVVRAVEDGCQVLDVPPAQKYDVSTEAVFTALVQRCDDQRRAALDLMRQLTFSVLIGNGDAHAKNFSVLQDAAGRWRVSPAYDLLRTEPYATFTLAMPLAGSRSHADYRPPLIGLGENLGLAADEAGALVTEVAREADTWLPGPASDPLFPGADAGSADSLHKRQVELLGASRL